MKNEPPATPPPPKKRSGSEKRERNQHVTFRASSTEKERFNKLAASHRQSIGDLLRTTLLGLTPGPAPRTPQVEHEDVIRLLAELGKVRSELGKHGSNLNQLVHYVNTGRSVE